MDIDDVISFLAGLIFGYWPFAVAIALGLLLPIIVIVLSSASAKWPDHAKLTVIFASVVIGNALTIAFSGRVIISDAELSAHPNLLSELLPVQGNEWFSRIAYLLMLSVSISEIIMWAFRKRHMGKTQFILWAAAITYFVLSVVVSGLFGTWRDFDIRIFNAPIIFTAVALLASSDFVKSLRALRWILFVPLFGSLLAMLVAPRFAMETDYSGLIPGLHIRLAGLTGHANALGLLAVVAFLLELSKFVCKKPNAILLLISISNLILAQSKTAWAIAILGFVIFRLHDVWKVHTQSKRSNAILAVWSGFFAFSAIAVFLAGLKIDTLIDFINTDKTGLITFTGRTKIWDITWDEFLNSPIFGYGPSIWDPLYRFQHGMLYVGQAHNQYIQTIGQAGLLGILSLAAYIMILVRNGFQGWSETYGFSFLIILVLLVRGLSETPMSMLGATGPDFFVHTLAFLTAAGVTMQAREKQKF